METGMGALIQAHSIVCHDLLGSQRESRHVTMWWVSRSVLKDIIMVTEHTYHMLYHRVNDLCRLCRFRLQGPMVPIRDIIDI